MYTRTGYLFLMEKKALGSSWNKYYCHYQKVGRAPFPDFSGILISTFFFRIQESGQFCMIPYNQTTPKIVSNETFKLKACIKRVSDSIDKRFCFDIIPEDK